MGQVLHESATTAEAVRRAVQLPEESVRSLAKRYGVTTVRRIKQGEIDGLAAFDVILSEELTLRENRCVKSALPGRLCKGFTGWVVGPVWAGSDALN